MVANILAGPLRELAPLISVLPKAGGHLGLSGVLASQAESVCEAYAERFALGRRGGKRGVVPHHWRAPLTDEWASNCWPDFPRLRHCLKSPPAPFSCRFFTLKSVDCCTRR